MDTMRRVYGNTVVTVHSPNGIISMTPEEKQKWFSEQWDQGNPYVRSLANHMIEFARKYGEQ